MLTEFDSSSDTAVMGDNFQDWSGDLTDDSIYCVFGSSPCVIW